METNCGLLLKAETIKWSKLIEFISLPSKIELCLCLQLISNNDHIAQNLADIPVKILFDSFLIRDPGLIKFTTFQPVAFQQRL